MFTRVYLVDFVNCWERPDITPEAENTCRSNFSHVR